MTVIDTDQLTALAFLVGGQRHAARLIEVDGVLRIEEVRPVPQPPPMVTGVVDRGGVMVPVYDLAAILRLPAPASKHVVLHRLVSGDLVAFQVDEVSGVDTGSFRGLPAQLSQAGGAVIGTLEARGGSAFLVDLDAAAKTSRR